MEPPRLALTRPDPADHILAMHNIIGTGVTEPNGTDRMVPLAIDQNDASVLIEKVSASLAMSYPSRLLIALFTRSKARGIS